LYLLGFSCSDWKFNLIIREIVEQLQYHYFEHEDYIERLSASSGLPLLVLNSFKREWELFPIHYFVEFNKWIAVVIKLFKTCLPIEKPCLHHVQSSINDLKNCNLLVNELNISNVQQIAPNLSNFCIYPYIWQKTWWKKSKH